MKTTTRNDSNRLQSQPVNPNSSLAKLRWGLLKAGCILGLLFATASPSQAQTTVCGVIAGQTWTSNGSPYLVTCDIQVTSLTIQPGVEVRFQGGYVFEVTRTLRASGTETHPIVFTTTNATVGWNSIFFNQCDPASFLTCCRISGATNSGVRIYRTTPALTNCWITNNSSPEFGGGINAVSATGTLVVKDCNIFNNVALVAGGGLSVAGTAEILHCTIAGNLSYSLGGGAHYVGTYPYRAVTFKNCAITNNIAGDYGGGIYGQCDSSLVRLENCIVASNSVGQYGAGIHSDGYSTNEILNCTIFNNNSSGIHMGFGSVAFVTNSILFFNNADGLQYDGKIYFEYCNVQSEGEIPPGQGNISQHPSIYFPTGELFVGSPCIDAGSPDAVYYDVCFPPSMGLLRNDMGAFGGPGACGWGIHPNSPAIITQPQPQVGCPGSSASFSVTASTNGGPLRYQWFQEDMPLDGQTGRILSLSGLDTSAVGHYSVMVSNDSAGISATAVLSMYEACVDLDVDGTNRRLSISGPAGTTYVLKYTTDLSNTDYSTWTPLATNTMGGSSWFYLDMESPFSPTRFYGVKIQQ